MKRRTNPINSRNRGNLAVGDHVVVFAGPVEMRGTITILSGDMVELIDADGNECGACRCQISRDSRFYSSRMGNVTQVDSSGS